jgi:hypothetical protein
VGAHRSRQIGEVVDRHRPCLRHETGGGDGPRARPPADGGGALGADEREIVRRDQPVRRQVRQVGDLPGVEARAAELDPKRLENAVLSRQRQRLDQGPGRGAVSARLLRREAIERAAPQQTGGRGGEVHNGGAARLRHSER